MSDSRSPTGIFILIGIMLFGLWLGVSLVTDQLETLIYVIGGITLITCALLGRKIWLILPFAGAVNLTLMIPGQPNTLLLAQALFVGFCVLQFLIRRLPFKVRITELEIWVILLTICVGQAYLRNPVGLNIFGGGEIGGRAYAIYSITLLSSFLLAFLRVPAADLRWILRLHIIGGIINFTLSTIGHFVPRVGVWYGAVGVSSLDASIQQDGQYGVDRASRIVFLGTAGRNIALWISAFKSPIRACFHPLWAPLILLSLAFAALSGFRNEIGAIGLTYLVGIAYRGGFSSVVLATLTLSCGIAILAFVNLAAPLPSNIQRSLSFLPGTWDQEQIKNAESSTQWRIEMWEAALLTDNWIQNKVYGDGLGMTLQEFNFIQSYKGKSIGGEVGTGKLNLDQELMMAAGNYHSGPVSTIRGIGYVGLFILLMAQIRLGIHAHRQIKRSRGTIWQTLTLLIGIPIIWTPFYFVFIFGDFGPALSAFLIGAAMLRLLENNLPLPSLPMDVNKQKIISNPVVSH